MKRNFPAGLVQRWGQAQKAGKLYLPAVQRWVADQIPPRLQAPLDESSAAGQPDES